MVASNGKRSRREPPIVGVEWEDTWGSSKWIGRRDLEAEPPVRCLSIGWLLSKTPKKLVLAASRDSPDHQDANWSDSTVIPMHCVVKITHLARVVRYQSKAGARR